MSLQTWLIYLLAATGLSLSPGPNSLLVITHGALYGRQRTLHTIAGGAVGFIGVVGLSMFGIGALLKTSADWLIALKWIGGLYLVWLGIQTWRSPGITLNEATQPRDAVSDGSLFLKGLLSAISNPKCLLFFSAFLPQFIDPSRSLLTQFAIMALTFAAIEALTECILATTAHRVQPWLAKVGKRFNRICGGIFVAVGIALPLRA